MERRTFVKGGAAALGMGALAEAEGCAFATGVGGTGRSQAGSEAGGVPGSESGGVPGALGTNADDAPGRGAEEVPDPASPQVFFSGEVSSQGVLDVFGAMGAHPVGKVAVKLSTGEPGGDNYLHADLIGALIGQLKGAEGVEGVTIVECNTAYGGERSSVESHYRVAEDHGFTAMAEFQVMDEEGSVELPVAGGTHLSGDLVGAHFPEYDWCVVLSHFKGHAMGGFGGALKNISIGIASREGKCRIHSAGAQDESIAWGTPQDDFLESMAEAAQAVCAHMAGNICYVNVMNRLSVDCDCDSHPAEPTMADIGVLASLDPVALDQACVDLVYAAPDGSDLVERIESRHGIRTVERAEELGVGSRAYDLVKLGDAE